MNGTYKSGDTVLNGWTLAELIGEGSYGKVFEAVRSEYGITEKAAIKIITIPQNQDEIINARTEGMSDDTVRNYFSSFVEEVIQEVALMSKLKGNDNIVNYEDYEVNEFYEGIGWDIIIRMELLTPLTTYISSKNFSKREIVKLGIHICKALELCKRYKIIHRDIKPENIFVSDTGVYKLGDFGIARTIEKTTGVLSKKGTYTYMAPEVYREEPYGANVDIYSLGIVLYRLLNNNRTPFLPPYPDPISYNDRMEALSKRIGGEEIPAPANDKGKLADIILRACAYDPDDRIDSPTQMKNELSSVIGGNIEGQDLSINATSGAHSRSVYKTESSKKKLSANRKKKKKNKAKFRGILVALLLLIFAVGGIYAQKNSQLIRQVLLKEEVVQSRTDEEKEIQSEKTVVAQLKESYQQYDNNNSPVTWRISEDKKTLIIYGKGPMDNYNYNAPWLTCGAEYVVICEGITTIGEKALWQMDVPVKGIYIPSTVESIGECFTDSTLLEEIAVSPDNRNFVSNDNVLYNNTFTELIKYPSAKQESLLALPETVESVRDYAIYGTLYLTKVNIPANTSYLSVYSIHGSLIEPGVNEINVDEKNPYFTSRYGIVYTKNMSSLLICPCGYLTEDITIPEEVVDISENAFLNVSKVKNITLPSGLKQIGKYAFSYAVSVEQIAILSEDVKINEYAFNGCYKLTSFKIPDSTETIRTGTFFRCNALNSVTIPKTVSVVEENAFSNCGSLNLVIYDGSEVDRMGISYKSGNEYLIDAKWNTVKNLRPYSYQIDKGNIPSNTDSLLSIDADWIAYSEDKNYYRVDIDIYASHNRLDYTSATALTISLEDQSETLTVPDIEYARTDKARTVIGSCSFLVHVAKGNQYTDLPLNIVWNYDNLYPDKNGNKVKIETVECSGTIRISNTKATTDIEVGDRLFFGTYEQDNNPTNGKERIPWLVLKKEGNKALILSEYCLDNLQYSEIEPLPVWESSTMRTWLNKTFYKNAFTNEELDIIEFTENINSTGKNTYDYVFLLSYDDYSVCVENFDALSGIAIAEPTPYAVSKGTYQAQNGKCWWWFRTAVYNGAVVTAGSTGEIHINGTTVTKNDIGVRPALWLDISNSEHETIEKVEEKENIGKIVKYGSYKQFDYDEKEPIEWIVLDEENGKSLLLSKYCLDPIRYNDLADCTWCTSRLRMWLNSTFISEAFSTGEASAIEFVNLENDSNTQYKIDGGNDTIDQMFILSYSEYQKYYERFKSISLEATPYAKARGVDVTVIDGKLKCTSWLRTPGEHLRAAVVCDVNDNIVMAGRYANYDHYSFRPAMWVKTDALNLD